MPEHPVGPAARHMSLVLLLTLVIPGAIGLGLDLYLGSAPFLTFGVSLIGITLATIGVYTYSARRLRALAEPAPEDENDRDDEEDSP